MQHLTRGLAVSALVAVAGLLAAPAQAAAPASVTELVTEPPGGGAPTGPGTQPSITPDGRYVAFESAASNLTATPDTLAFTDVFVRDTRTGVTRKISTGRNGVEADADSGAVRITPDGRYAVFVSGATDLVAGDDPDTIPEIFFKNLRTGRTQRIFSHHRLPREHGRETEPSISADGSTVAFASTRADLVKRDTNKVNDIFVWKRATGRITRVDVSSAGKQAGTGRYDRYAASLHPEISADGTTVVFQSGAKNLVKGDTNSISDIFSHSLTTGRTIRVSVGPKGRQATGGRPALHVGAQEPTISANGKFIAYSGLALKGILKQNTGPTTEAYVYNRSTGSTQLVAHTSAGRPVDGQVSEPTISPDGRFVAFRADSNQLVKGDAGIDDDVFVRDLRTQRIVRVSVALKGTVEYGASGALGLGLSAGGRRVVFTSDDQNLTAEPVLGRNDLYLRTLAPGFWGK